MNYVISIIPPDRCRSVWKSAKVHLKRAIEVSHGRWEPEYVLASLVLGEHNLWIVVDDKGTVDGTITTQIVHYPEKTMLAVHFLGGDHFDDWYQYLLDTLSRYAKDGGCAGIECIARHGFWKWFKQDGFQKTSVFYEKLL